MSPRREMPELEIGGEEAARQKLLKGLAVLGNAFGLLVFGIAAFMIGLDLILNPVFLFAQAKSSGVDVGSILSPFDKGLFGFFGLLCLLFITVCTSGIQYALLKKGTKRWSFGWIIGVIAALADSFMDGGGFEAWRQGGNVLSLTGDSSHLQFGIFPPVGATADDWGFYVFVSLLCFAHEPFLRLGLAFVKGKNPRSDPFNANMGKWVKRAGNLLSWVTLVILTMTPYLMLLLDIFLFPQIERDKDSVTLTLAWVGAVVTAGVAVMLWRFWGHLSKDVGLSFRDLNWKLQAVFLIAAGWSTFDSWMDLRGLNSVVYHQSVAIPQDLPPGGFGQWAVTATITMILCTGCAPMISDLFAPFGAEVGAGELSDADIARIAEDAAKGYTQDMGGRDYTGGTGPKYVDPDMKYPDDMDDRGGSSSSKPPNSM